MARLFDGTNDSLQSAATIDLSGVNKITVAFWLWWDAFANDFDMALEFTAAADSFVGSFQFDPNWSSGDMRTMHMGNAGESRAHYTRPSAATWHHYAYVIDKSLASAESDLYIDGVLQTPTSRPLDANNTDNFANSTLNVMSRNNASFFSAGRMAELAIYPGEVLNAREAMALFRGVNVRRIRPASSPYYWPLWGLHSPEIGLRSGSPAMTVNGAVATGHAPVRPYTRVDRATFPLADAAGGFQAAWAQGSNRLISGGVMGG